MKRNLQPTDRTDPPRPGKSRRTQFGLKELASGISPNIDIVAIHEIDGDREGSWTADNSVLWLRDLLPEKVPNARILTYGYDAITHGQEQATDFMHEHAMTFISKLALFRETTDTAERPIIFVAHGSGGLLLKSALIHSRFCHNDHLKHHLAISQSTHGIAFFGTPHQGCATAGPTSNVLVQHLDGHSEVLQQQLALYSAICGEFETKFFYETFDTPVAGTSKRVVPRTSAVVPGAVNAEAIGIHKDHVHMIKFRSADDEDFWTVSTALFMMSTAACRRMAEKGDCFKETVLTHSQETALSNLHRVADARFNADSRPRCLEGTRVDLLETIIEWAEQEISGVYRRIFWLCGQAGTGKTTISLTVAGDCQEKGRLGATFLFSRDDAERSDLQLVFPTLAQQLGIFHQPFRVLLAKVIEEDPDLIRMEPGYQFKKMIVEPIKLCGTFPASTMVVIDALDECKDDNPVSRMLSILSDHIKELPCLKFFITSRPEDHIRGGFNPLSTVTQTIILHDIEASVVDGDIEHYLRHGFSITAPRQYPALVKPDWVSDESIKSLVRQSGRLFIFAATAMNFILDRNYSNPVSQLATLLGQSSTIMTPSSPFALLDQLYLQVLRQAFPSRTTPPHILDLLRVILGPIVLLRDPLSPGALESLLSLSSGTVRTTLRHLHSVIIVPDTDEYPIRLIHPSFFDFVTTRCSDVDFRIDSLLCHEQLAMACFKQMKGLKRNICEIPDASKLNNEIEDLAERIERSISPAMRHACLHWPFHLLIAGGTTLQGMFGEFCYGQILYWIEALSLLGYLREGIRHLQYLSKYLKIFSTPSKDLLDALIDSTRFMADHFELMSRASLQLYRSALPLSAPSSFLRKNFHHDLNAGMRVLQGEWADNISAGVTILRGPSWVTSVDFSPDGTLIASSSQSEIRLWDRGTGTILVKLNVPLDEKAVMQWVRFFPDGSRVIALITASEGTIRIWNIASGAYIQTIRLGGVKWHWLSTISSTISPDFTRIVGSVNNSIYIWHISNGDLLKTLCDTRSAHSVAFSSDHSLIASASDDEFTIHIWDAINGAKRRTLRGHSSNYHPSNINRIAFSPNSKYIVSGSSSYSHKDIRIWDVSSGVALQILERATGGVRSVAISPDAARVIFGYDNGTIEVWDAIGCKVVETVRYSEAVHIVGSSTDGMQYISAAAKTIYIWDANGASNSDEEKQDFDDDGTSLTDEANSEEIPSARTGRQSNPFHSDINITLSPNQKYIACNRPASHWSETSTFYLWDIASRTILWEEKGRTGSVAFSLDSTRIVSLFSTETRSPLQRKSSVRILDVANGSNLFSICLDSLVKSASLRFSHDGSQIIMEDHPYDIEDDTYDIPPHVRPHSIPSMNESVEQLKYLIDGEWIFASNGTEKERCVWIPEKWRIPLPGMGLCSYSSSHGQVAIATGSQLVLLDLSAITLSI